MADATVSGSTPERGDVAVVTLLPWWLILVQGIVALLVGAMLLASPARTTLVLIQVLAWYWLLGGILQLGSLFVDRTMWGLRVAGGLLGILVGGFIVGAPLVGAAAVVGGITLWLGIVGIAIGVSDLARAFRGGGWGIGVLGALSFVVGIAVVLDVPAYMVALPWIWAILALVSGAAAIIGAFQLRKLQGT